MIVFTILIVTTGYLIMIFLSVVFYYESLVKSFKSKLFRNGSLLNENRRKILINMYVINNRDYLCTCHVKTKNCSIFGWLPRHIKHKVA